MNIERFKIWAGSATHCVSLDPDHSGDIVKYAAHLAAVKAAVEEERERCAKVCDEREAACKAKINELQPGSLATGVIASMEEQAKCLASAIRSLGKT